MRSEERIELFVLKCAVIEAGVREVSRGTDDGFDNGNDRSFDDQLEVYVRQFEIENRSNAQKMSRYYRIFYMLENDIRHLIADTLEAAHGSEWWKVSAPQAVKDDAARNRQREEQAGVTTRSDTEIDYTTFGQLSDIIKENWTDFAGIMRNQAAVLRVLSGLNMLRGTIAHCGVLADDEVDRLKLAIKDWFRVLEGPKS